MEYKELLPKRKKKNDVPLIVNLDELLKATGWTVSEAMDILRLSEAQKKAVLAGSETKED
ncbi:MAG: hypothetical protein K6D03_00700 [Solobacterium sp.]|nr:hypothetical protein [Solobacterium sp.]